VKLESLFINTMLMLFISAMLFPKMGEAGSKYHFTDELTEGLGNGYDTDFDSAKPYGCLNGNLVTNDPGDIYTQIYFTSNYTHENLYSEYKNHIDGKAQVSAWNIDASVDFREFSRETNTSFTYLFKYYYRVPNYRYDVTDTVPFMNDRGVNASNISLDEFKRVCGNKYVSQAEVGGEFLVAVKFDFRTESLKEEFVSGGSASSADFYQIKQKVNQLYDDFSGKGTVSINAFQRGGDASYLGAILGGVTDGDEIKSCESLSACMNILDGLIAYIGPQGVLSASWASRPAILKYIKSDYNQVVPGFPYVPTQLTPEIEQVRNRLRAEFIQQYADINYVDRVIHMSIDPDVDLRIQPVKDTLTLNGSTISANIIKILDAENLCYDDLSLCVQYATTTLNSIGEYTLPEMPFLVFPEDTRTLGGGNTEVSCKTPALSVVTGLGARVASDNVTTIRMRYREILANGQLGPQKIKYCGSSPYHSLEAEYIVPDGYVVVGVGGRVNGDNMKTLAVYYRLLDTTTRSLLGPTLVGRAGTNPYRSLELNFIPENYGYNQAHTVLTGVGMRSNSDNLRKLVANIGWVE
jgi:hypothetical protein